MIVYDSHGVRRNDVAVGFVVFSWLVEVERLASQTRRLIFCGRIRFGRFLRFRLLFGFLFLDLNAKQSKTVCKFVCMCECVCLMTIDNALFQDTYRCRIFLRLRPKKLENSRVYFFF